MTTNWDKTLGDKTLVIEINYYTVEWGAELLTLMLVGWNIEKPKADEHKHGYLSETLEFFRKLE